jgi:uncharacterized membrane protein YccC
MEVGGRVERGNVTKNTDLIFGTRARLSACPASARNVRKRSGLARSVFAARKGASAAPATTKGTAAAKGAASSAADSEPLQRRRPRRAGRRWALWGPTRKCTRRSWL